MAVITLDPSSMTVYLLQLIWREWCW